MIIYMMMMGMMVMMMGKTESVGFECHQCHLQRLLCQSHLKHNLSSQRHMMLMLMMMTVMISFIINQNANCRYHNGIHNNISGHKTLRWCLLCEYHTKKITTTIHQTDNDHNNFLHISSE